MESERDRSLAEYGRYSAAGGKGYLRGKLCEAFHKKKKPDTYLRMVYDTPVRYDTVPKLETDESAAQ